MPLTIAAYPHLAEAVIASADPTTLLSLRRVSTWFKSLADARLYRHLAHDIATDSTRTIPLCLRVDLFANAAAVSALRMLDLELGEYRDPNSVEIDLDDWGADSEGSGGSEGSGAASEGASEASAEWKDDTAAVLPRAANLHYAVLHGSHTSVFRHVLQNRHVPTVICPVRRSDFVRDWLGEPKASVGAYLPTNRVWIVADQGPAAGVLRLQLFREKPLHVAVVLLPPGREAGSAPGAAGAGGAGGADEDAGDGEHEEQPPEGQLWFYDSLVHAVAAETATAALETPDGAPLPDVPATFVVAGLEAWNQACPLPGGRTWEDRFRADFEIHAAQRYDPADAENHLKRLSITTLDEWRRGITDEEWDIVADVSLE